MNVFEELVAKRIAIKATRLGGAAIGPLAALGWFALGLAIWTLIMFTLFWLVAPGVAQALAMVAGNLLGAMFYEYMHYEMQLGTYKKVNDANASC